MSSGQSAYLIWLFSHLTSVHFNPVIGLPMTRFLSLSMLPLVLLSGCSGPTPPAALSETSESVVQDDADAIAALKAAGASFRLDDDGLVTEVNLRKATVDDTIPAALLSLTNVTSVLFNDSDVTDDHLTALTKWSSPVVNIDLRGCSVGNDGVMALANLKTLKAIRLNEAAENVDDIGIVALAALPKLKVLAADGLWIGDESVEAFTESTTLEELYLKSTNISDDALKAMGQIPSLRKIRLAMNGISDDGLAYLKPLTNLVELDLSENSSLTNAATEALSSLTSLEKLNLWRLAIGDEGILRLRPLRDLVWLNLDNTQLSNAGLDALSDMKQLSFLHLGSTGVSDDGLPKLTHLKNLKDLKLTRTAVTEAGAAELATSLPDTDIQLLYIEGQ